MNLQLWTLLLLIVHQLASSLANDCSELNISNNLQQCLTSIWTKANDKNAFWFGTKWLSICGYNPFAAPYCAGIRQPYTPHSLLNTIYGLDWDLSQNPLTQFLYVTYHTTTGSYKSCGNTYTVTETKTIELEPLLSKNYHPWDTITRPDITWTPSANILYTLIIYDAGAYISHGVYINIEGNDIDNSEAVRVYIGPKNSSTRKQPYVFLLYEQTNRINLTDEWRQKLSQSMVRTAYNFTDVFQDLQLKGPKAMNWIQVVKDPYSVQYFVDEGVINNCPNMVSEALKSKNVSFIPDDVDLSMTLDIELHNTALEFESCCTSYSYQEHTAKLNPLGNGYISPGKSRSDSEIKIRLQKEGLLFIPTPSPLHTLACVDISVPDPAAGTPDLPLLHMLVTNINGSDLSSGDVIQPYRGPAPPDYLNHTYIFLLYSQKLVHSENETRNYLTEGCSARLSGRCLFNMTRFVMGNSLKLVGTTWFISTTDEFVRYSYIGGGQNPDDICKNINGYGNPCPVGEGYVLKANLTVMTILAICAWLFVL